MIAPVMLLAALIGAWELYASVGGVDQVLLPAPSAVATALVDDRSLLWADFRVTAVEVLLGIALALLAGILIATVVHLSPVLRRAVTPLLVASQTIPIAIVAPLLVAWLGFGLLPKLAIVALICCFPIAVATLDALARVDPDLPALMTTLGASRWRTFRLVEAPSALPGLLSGLRIAVAIGVLGAVLAEQAGSDEGLGFLLLQAIPQLETARAYAAVVVLSVFAVALFGLIALAERRALPWLHRGRPTI